MIIKGFNHLPSVRVYRCFWGVLLLLASSCGTQKTWEVEHIRSENQRFASSRLCCASTDHVNGIDLYFVNTLAGITAYLALHSVPVPSSAFTPHEVTLKVIAEEEQFQWTLYKMQGGQHLSLNKEATAKLIDLLKSKPAITMILEGYRTVLKTDGFSAQWEKFTHPAPWNNPFYLSL